MTEFNKCTCVKVNKDKMDLIKAKGINLQDILDKAMDNELQMDEVESIEKEIRQLDEKIEKLTKQRDDNLEDCQKKIDILLKYLTDLKKQEEDISNKEINFLKLKRDYLIKKLQQ